MHKRLVIALALLLSSVLHLSAQQQVHNGFWWKELSGTAKSFYVTGFVEGNGKADLYWRVAKDSIKARFTPEVKAGLKNINDFSQVRFGQFVDGLDEFYKDYRNTSIHVDDAICHVRDEIKGAGEKYLEDDLRTLRQNAAQPGYDQ